jgi:hypothetical protein
MLRIEIGCSRMRVSATDGSSAPLVCFDHGEGEVLV